MKKPEKKPKPKKRSVAVKDLTAKNATKVKGGLNPQPEPPMLMDHKSIINPTINPSTIAGKLLKY
jgi:hypothetical protein